MEQDKQLTEKTYAQVLFFLQAAGDYLENNKDEESKIKYAIKRVVSRLSEFHKEYSEKKEDLRLDYVSVDEKGHISTTEKGNYNFTPSNMKKLDKAVRSMEKECTFSFEPYYATTIPSSFDVKYEEAFKGFILKEDFCIPEPS